MSHSAPSPEELFARRFGYGAPAHPPALPVIPYDEFEAVTLRPRPRSIRRRLTPFTDDEESNLVVLPSPPLRKPSLARRLLPHVCLIE